MPANENSRMTTASQLVNRVGFWSASLTATWTLAFLITAFLLHSQALAVAAAFLLAPSFVILINCLNRCAIEEQKLWSQIALSFSIIYATVIGLNYFLFLTVVRQSPKAYPRLTMDFRSDSAFWALESLGYTFMSLAALWVAPLFSGNKANNAVRWLFVVNGVANIVAVAAVLITGNPLHALVLVSLGVWSIAFPAASILLAVIFKRAERSARLAC